MVLPLLLQSRGSLLLIEVLTSLLRRRVEIYF
jgi:hypothetical protein